MNNKIKGLAKLLEDIPEPRGRSEISLKEWLRQLPKKPLKTVDDILEYLEGIRRGYK